MKWRTENASVFEVGRYFWDFHVGCRFRFTNAVLSIPDKQLLYSLAALFRHGGTIVEIGSFTGGSACLFAKAAPGATIYCVDPWSRRLSRFLNIDNVYELFLENTAKYPNIRPLRGLSEDIARTFDLPVDLLFIDGDHSFSGVSTDLKCWCPKLAPESFMVCHDANREGVRRAIIDYFGSFHVGITPFPSMYVVERDERLAVVPDL
jgi:predicted O-methyltransferase YrrM